MGTVKLKLDPHTNKYSLGSWHLSVPQGQHLHPMVAGEGEVGGGTEVVGKEEVWTRGVACWGCLWWCCGSQVRWKLTWSHSLCKGRRRVKRPRA